MFEDQSVELLPARTVMTTWGGFSFTKKSASGYNGGNQSINAALLSGNNVQVLGTGDQGSTFLFGNGGNGGNASVR